MHKPKSYKCSICGAEIPDLPMPVLKHQMSHVTRRPFARAGMSPAAPIRAPAIWNSTTSASCRPARAVR
jgi:hypothetical protein